MQNNHVDVDSYIQAFPDHIQKLLQAVRTTIREAVPEAEEGIGYGMPVFKLFGKPLVYFAAFKQHIGFYATPTGHAEFAEELSKYKQGKGSVQFPFDQPLPLKLIAKIAAFRAKENAAKQTKIKASSS